MTTSISSRKESVRPVIVVPMYRSQLSPDEMISIKHLVDHLRRYDTILCVPNSLLLDEDKIIKGCGVIRFPDYYFKSTQSYSRLLMSRHFYESFADWTHLLIYQLDCLVFSDQLEEWCRSGYDYIGAPWLNKYFLDNTNDGLWRAGNGGFSLRNIQSCLSILTTKAYSGSLFSDGGPRPWNASEAASELGLYSSELPSKDGGGEFSRYVSTIESEAKSYSFNEDAFWSIEAPKINSTFNVISAKEALRFAFEMSPWWCYNQNNRKLPFGCHAWSKYGRNFWMAVLSGAPCDPTDMRDESNKTSDNQSPDDIMVILRNQESCISEQMKYIRELELICLDRLNVIQGLNLTCEERLCAIEVLKERESYFAEQVSRFRASPFRSALEIIFHRGQRGTDKVESIRSDRIS